MDQQTKQKEAHGGQFRWNINFPHGFLISNNLVITQ